MTKTLEERVLPVAHPADVTHAARVARDLAESVGFETTPAEEIRLVARELGTNVLRHARSGRMTLRSLRTGDRDGVELETVDNGPGIPDVDQALADGFSTAGGMGCGLGAADRMADELLIDSPLHDGRGTRVVFRRWTASEPSLPTHSSLSAGAATVARLGERLNGDAYVIRGNGRQTLVAVIDGVGHGAPAHEAAQAARAYLVQHASRPIPTLFAGVARCCRPTRGVVMAVARINEDRGTLRFASVGNIEARTPPHGPHRPFRVLRGILGGRAPAPIVSEHPWRRGDILILHSDGIPSNWRWDSVDPALWTEAPDRIARRLVREMSHGRDDTTVLVVRGGRLEGKPEGAESPERNQEGTRR